MEGKVTRPIALMLDQRACTGFNLNEFRLIETINNLPKISEKLEKVAIKLGNIEILVSEELKPDEIIIKRK